MKGLAFLLGAFLPLAAGADKDAGQPAGASPASYADLFVFTQLSVGSSWDPYPDAYRDIVGFVTDVTSVIVSHDRKVMTLADPDLALCPFLVLTSRQAPPELGPDELARLRDYLTSGGFLWVDDASGTAASSFDSWVRRTLKAALPDSDLRPLPGEHVLFKTFFFMRRVGGRVMVSGSVEGVDWAGQTVVVYTRNDVLGAWAKDPLGHYLYSCAPGGEAQRMQARKLALNIVMYALTGSYKADAVHQPFLLEKLRQGQP